MSTISRPYDAIQLYRQINEAPKRATEAPEAAGALPHAEHIGDTAIRGVQTEQQIPVRAVDYIEPEQPAEV